MQQFGKSYGIDPHRRRNVVIVYGEPQTGISNVFRATMRREGFVDVRPFSTLAPMMREIMDARPDLVIMDGEMPGGDACALVRAVREGRIGSNPFVCTIVTSWRATQGLARSVVDSGSDDLLLKPNSPDQLMQRIGALVHRRKPFVATSDYIGPERRSGEEPGVPRIEVPNTLQAKATGQRLDDADFTALIDTAVRAVNEQRLKRHALLAAAIVGRIVPAYRSGRAAAAAREETEQLLALAEDTVARLRGTAYEAVADICATLRRVAETVVRSHPEPERRDLDLLPKLTAAMVLGFDAQPGTAGAAGAISTSVGAYLSARARPGVDGGRPGSPKL